MNDEDETFVYTNSYSFNLTIYILNREKKKKTNRNIGYQNEMKQSCLST